MIYKVILHRQLSYQATLEVDAASSYDAVRLAMNRVRDTDWNYEDSSLGDSEVYRKEEQK